MKKIFIPFLLFLISHTFSFSNGICIVDASTGTYFTLVGSHVEVEINNQIAIIRTTQVFRNNTGENAFFKYGFPMPETGSATSLRWQNGQFWYEADFAPVPQDTIIPGGGGDNPTPEEQLIKNYLGSTPLYFEPNQMINAGALVTMELEYVMLLPYSFNKVSFYYPNDYASLQTETLDFQQLSFVLNSDRQIDYIDLLSHSTSNIVNSGNVASVDFVLNDGLADKDYFLEYELNSDELGLFSFSTFLPESAMPCDTFGRGYLAFVVEPDPSDNTAVIEKEFTLIIDRSGSMGGEKMAQAREAAKFIVNNLNSGDYFNVIAFDGQIISFQPDHVPYNVTNEADALSFISGLFAGGSTNISGAFSEAIPQFQNSNANTAKIIIFFTDGQATSGITSTQDILDHVSDLRSFYDVEDLIIFTFGIGANVNNQLLSQLATQNNGLSEFLNNDELQEVISTFYLTIQNPVLLNTQMFFTPPIVTEAYPQPLPNLFKGQQLIVVGRYASAEEVTVHFTGTAFGEPVEYQYTFNLADTSVTGNQFLPRLWAKKKIEHLNVDYYDYVSTSDEALAIEEGIVDISLCYGVISPFTSFGNNTGGGGSSTTGDSTLVAIEFDDFLNQAESITATPNPFQNEVWLHFALSESASEPLWIEIYDAEGRLIRRIEAFIGQDNSFDVKWDGNNDAGITVVSGVYFIKLQYQSKTYLGSVVKI